MSNCGDYSLELRKIGNPFTFEYDFYDEMFRCNFEKKFCDYYAFDEIGFETIERFKHNLKAHLNLKMPYYDQLYRTELATEDLDFLLNKDYRETFLRTVDTEENLKGTNSSNSNTGVNGNSSSSTSNQGTSAGKESNIADGVASASLDDRYLTGVSEVKQNGTTSTNNTNGSTTRVDANGNNTEDKTGKLMEKTELIGQGNIGVTSSAELLEKWRNVLINIDEQIILGCRDLFMGVF